MYSKPFKTIFVHVPKTGGQSIEHIFLERQGLTWGGRGELLMRENKDRSLGPRRLAHLLACEYVGLGHLTQDEWDACYKFAIVRNPYSRAVSQFRYRTHRRIANFPDFVTFLEDSGETWRQGEPQANYVVDEAGKPMIETILRFERLSEDVRPVLREIFKEDVELPHVNQSKAPVPEEAADPAVRRRVYKLYERDFDLFQYPREF